MDDAALRDRIGRMLAAGQLPAADPTTVWAGPSLGRTCAACSARMQTSKEYELTFRDSSTLRLHPRCYVLWEEARSALQRRNRRPREAS